MLRSPGDAENSNYIWDTRGQRDFPNKQDLIALIRECKALANENKIMNVAITRDQLTLGNLIRIIELIGRYDLYNIKFDQFKMESFPPRAIKLMKNPKYVSFWFFELIGKAINPNDLEQMEKIATIIDVAGPRELSMIRCDCRDRCIYTNCNGQTYTIKLDPEKEESEYLYSFSIMTREGNVKLYLCEGKKPFVDRGLPLNFVDNASFVCVYGAKKYIRHPKISQYFDQTNFDKSIITLVPDGMSADLISLAEYDNYVQKYSWDDPGKGFGTRLFYYNEADAINKNLFPSNASSFKVLTMINKDEVAIHETPKKYYKKPVSECEKHVKQLVRVPRLLSLRKERINQLLSDHTIEIMRYGS